ncbi:MAG: nitroreductase family protein, partial [Candidatus Aminicenantes bacterium]|nr:nitroreductase family protein [Candidatus Aminicenantes bacterium]
MKVFNLILSRRTIRQFKPKPVPRSILKKIIDAARLAPSAANRQPLEFLVVDDKEVVDRIFPCLKWAGYIVPEGNPRPGREPTSYIITLINSKVRKSGFEWDAGAAIENMILSALEEGIGSCWLASVDREKVRDIFGLPEDYTIDSILALGYPDESPVVEELVDSVEYWKDEHGRIHVPKRKL